MRFTHRGQVATETTCSSWKIIELKMSLCFCQGEVCQLWQQPKDHADMFVLYVRVAMCPGCP